MSAAAAPPPGNPDNEQSCRLGFLLAGELLYRKLNASMNC